MRLTLTLGIKQEADSNTHIFTKNTFLSVTVDFNV